MGVIRLEDASYPRLDALNKKRTIFLIPVGMLEQHGPHLPVGSDSLQSQARANVTAEALNERRPDITIVLFPLIPLGVHPVDLINPEFKHVGSFWLRHATLRDMIIDVGLSIIRYDFKFIVVESGHASPLHILAIDLAASYVSEKYGAKMFHINPIVGGLDLKEVNSLLEGPIDNKELDEARFDFHAGIWETSRILHLKPEIVDGIYRELESSRLEVFHDIYGKATEREWKGYLGTPRLGRADFGEVSLKLYGEKAAEAIIRVLDGSPIPKVEMWFQKLEDGVQRAIDNSLLEDEKRIEEDFSSWIENKRILRRYLEGKK